MNNFYQRLLTQQKQIRKEWKRMAKIYPGCFDKHGKPLVATLPPLPEYA